MNSTTKLTCIYCDQPRLFSDEHVFPAGMGGDDSDYILRNLVCSVCNTNVFSPLEAQLMRNSPYALARLYMQPTGRLRGSKAAPPAFEHDRCEIIDEDGHVSEAQLVGGWSPTTLPQIQILGNEVRVVGRDAELIEALFADLSSLLGSLTNVIEKIQIDEKFQFEVTRFLWDGHDYQEEERTIQGKPPTGIWLDGLAGSEGKAIGWPRIYKRHRGQIVLRVMTAADAGSFLSGLKRTLPSLIATKLSPSHLVEQPLVQVGMKAVPHKIFRAMVKIGFNFACHEYGDRIVRSSAFDRTRNFVLNGTEAVPLTDVQNIQAMFSHDSRPVHVVILYPQEIGDGYVISVLIRLYGGGVLMFILAENVVLPAQSFPLVFTVSYLENKIERLDITEYIHYLSLQMRNAAVLEHTSRQEGE